MTSLETVATTVLADLNIEGNFVLAARWAKDRYVDLLTNVNLNQARRFGSLTLPANLSDGTVSVTQDTTTVTGNAAAQTAWATQGSLIGWHFRGSREWYKIVGQTTSTLTLHIEYSEDTITAGTYLLRKREFELPLDVKRLGLFSHARRHRIFYPTHLETLIALDPARVTVTGGPTRVMDINAAPSGAKVIEIYPGSDTLETIDYIYWTTPFDLALSAPLPTIIDASQLGEGVKINAYEWLMAKAADANQLEKAAFYKNNSDRQRTIWEAFKRKLIRQDGAMDDATLLVVQSSRRGFHRDQRLDSIQNARDFVFNTVVS